MLLQSQALLAICSLNRLNNLSKRTSTTRMGPTLVQSSHDLSNILMIDISFSLITSKLQLLKDNAWKPVNIWNYTSIARLPKLSSKMMRLTKTISSECRAICKTCWESCTRVCKSRLSSQMEGWFFLDSLKSIRNAVRSWDTLMQI